MNVLQLVAPVAAPVVSARKVSPEKALSKAKKTKASVPSAKAKKTKASVPGAKAEVVVTELNALRAELQALSGAPVSPTMTIAQLKVKIEAIKNPAPEPEEVEEVEEVEVVEKVKVIPSKPQGIGAYCVAQLKEGVAPKVVLSQALEKFPSAKTSMACVYWYASKIKQGLL